MTAGPPGHQAVTVTADVVLFTIRGGQLAVLLRRWPDGAPGTWALPSTVLGNDEDADAAARRALRDATGQSAFGGHLEQLRTYTAATRAGAGAGRAVAIAHAAMEPDLANPPVSPGDSGNGRGRDARFWWTSDVLGPGGDAVPLALDHRDILLDAVERVRSKLEYTSLATSFVEEPFTIGELRHVYESVWDVQLHRANFRRAVLSVQGFVVPAEPGERAAASPAVSHGAGQRPAQLYRRGPVRVLHPAILRPGPASEDPDDPDEG